MGRASTGSHSTCGRGRRPQPWRRWATALLLCGPAFAAAQADGQPAKPPDEAAPATQDRAEQAGEAETAGSEGPQQEVFLPSEEISEDFAAPFPVDI